VPFPYLVGVSKFVSARLASYADSERCAASSNEGEVCEGSGLESVEVYPRFENA